MGTSIFEALLWWTLMDWGRLFSKPPCGGLWWTGASLFEALLWWTLVNWGFPLLSPPVVFMTNWHQHKVDAGGLGSPCAKPPRGGLAKPFSKPPRGGLCWILLDSVGLYWTLESNNWTLLDSLF